MIILCVHLGDFEGRDQLLNKSIVLRGIFRLIDQKFTIAVFCLFATAFLLPGVLRAQVIFDDNFSYNCCGNLGGNGGWVESGSGSSPNVNGSGLFYSLYANSGIGNSFQLFNPAGRSVEHVSAASITGGSVFASFLLQVNGGVPTTGQVLMNFQGNGSSTLNQTTGFVVSDNGGLKFGLINAGSSTMASTIRSYSSTYLVVIQYKSSTKQYSLFVNPVTDGAQPAADLSITYGGSTATTINTTKFYQNGGGSFTVDGLRVGRVWGDVAVSTSSVASSLLLNDPFIYGDQISNHGWNSFTGSGGIQASGSGLIYNGLGTGNSVQLQCCSFTGFYKSFPTVNNGTIYASFLVQQNFGVSSDGEPFLNFHSNSNSTFNQQQGFVLDNQNLGILYGFNNLNTGSSIPSGNTVMVVMGYNINTGQYSLFYNPALGTSSPPGPDVTAMSNNPASSIDGFSIINPSNGVSLLLDEFRVSTVWSDVVQQVVTPTDQPTNLVFSSFSTTGFSFNFQQAASGPNGYIVFRGTGAPALTTPVNGTSYFNGQITGDATVVSNNGTNISDFGLAAGTTYYYSVYSYNTNGSTYSYNTTEPLQGIAATRPTSPPSSLTFSNVSDTQAQLNYTAATPPLTGYIITRGQFSFASGLTDGTPYNIGDIVNTSTVVYIGPNTTFTDTGLSTNTTYYYDVYSYAYESYSQISLNSTVQTIAPQPTNQPTLMTFANPTTNSIDVSFTPAIGGANGYLLIFKSGASPTNGAPVDGTNYVIGNTLGGGTVGGSSGTTTFTVNGLVPNIQYFFDVYSYNGFSNITNYLEGTTPLEGSSYTLTLQPTGQPTALNFTSLTSTGFNVGFTAAAPVPTAYIALRNTGTIFNSPVDGTTYTVGNTLPDNSRVAYIGAATSFIESTLTAATSYNYSIFSYAIGVNPATVNYNPVSPLGGVQTTLASPPTTQASNIIFSGVTNNQMTLSWTNGNGNQRLILAHATTAVSATPVNGVNYTANSNFGSGSIIGAANYVVYNSSGNNVTISGLSASTVYNFEIFEFNGSGTTSSYYLPTATNNPAGQTTLAAPPTVVSSAYNFSSVTTSQMTVAWTSGNGARRVVLAHAGSGVDSNPVNGTGYTANAAFGSGSQIGVGNYVVYDGTGNTVTVTALNPAVTYYFWAIEYNGTAATINYFNNGTMANQITLATLPLTQSSNILFSSVTNNATTLNWTNGSGASRLVVAHAGAAVNSNPVSGTAYTANAVLGSGTQIGVGNYVVYSGTGSSVTVTGLASATVNYYQVFDFNGSAASANYLTTTASSNPLSQTTLASAPTTQSSAIVFSSSTASQTTLTWTNGNGARRVVLAHAGAAVNSNPVNATTYTANAAFGSGTQIGVGNYVVYDGTGNTVTVAGLTASTIYNYEVFDYNGTTTTINYLTTTAAGNPGAQTSLATLPVTQTTNILFSGITTTSMTLNWTSGSGANRVVVAHAGAAVDANPVGATSYTANTVMGSGTQIGTGNYVVYNGTGSTVTVTGLTISTVYYFEIFEYNGSGSTLNYLTTTVAGNPANQSTVVSAPTTQSSAIVFSAITTTQMTLNWTSGNGARRVVLAHAGAAVNSNPLSSTTYTANAIFGSGSQIGSGNYVVYDGTGSTVTVTGLSPNVIYNYEVYDYNGTTVTINYSIATATGNPGAQTTLASVPTTQATSILFSAMTTTQMTLNWTNGNGTNRLVVAHSAAAVDSNPVGGVVYTANTVMGSGTQIGTGNYVVYNGTGTSVTVTSLAPTTVIYFEVYEYNGTAGAQNYMTTTSTGNPASQSTLTGPPTVQSSAILFSGVTTTQMTLTWTNGNGAKRTVLAHAAAAVNSNPVNGTTYTANAAFGSGTQIGVGNYVVYDGSGNTVTVTGLTSGTVYNYEIYDYNGAGVTVNYITSVATGNPGAQTTLSTLPVTQATNIVFSGMTTTAMTLNWTNGSGANRIVIAHSGAAVNSNPVSGTGYTANAALGSGSQIGAGNYVVYDGSGSTVTVTGLSVSTINYFEVFEYNGTAASANYLTTTSTNNPANQSTLVAAPSTQSSSIVFSSPTASQMTLTWTNGNGSRRVVLAHAGAVVNSNPVNSTTYTANAAFGSGTQIGVGNYVVYDGTGNTVTVTGLTASTVYNYEVFDYNGTTTTINYLTTTATGNPGAQTSLATLPVTQATNILFSGITTTSMTLNWTSGSGANRVVVAHAGAAVDSNPLGGTSYTANSVFTSGTQIGTGNYVVYNGTGGTVTVTGLTISTVYYFEIFEYNGSGASLNYLTSAATGNPANQSTVVSAPTTQSSAIVFSGITTTQMTLNWTSGNGARRVVLAHAGAAVNSNPASSTTYTASATFGSGAQIGSGNYVVYDGTGSTVTVTGLSPNIIYNYEVYDYNGTTVTINYSIATATGNPGAQTTLASVPTTQATSILFSGVTTTQMTLNWSNGNGASRLVVAHSAAAVDSNPVGGVVYSANSIFGSGTQIGVGNYVVYDGTGTTVTVTSLAPTTAIYFEIYEYNGTAGAQNYMTATSTGNPANQSTLTGPPTVQATNILFSGITNNQLTLNWTVGNGANRIVLAHSGAAVNATPSNSTSYSANAVFGSGAQIGTGNYVVYNGSSNTVTVTGLTSATAYYFQVFELNGSGVTANYFVSTAAGNPANTSTVANPASVQATNLLFSSISNNGLTVGWTNGNGARRIVLAKAGSAVNSNPVNGNPYTASAAFSTGTQVGTGNYVVYDGTSNSVTVTGLSSATAYYFEVYEYNGVGVTANYLTTTGTNNPNNQTTLAAPPGSQASAITFSSLTNSQIAVSWSSGSGTRRVVLVHAGAAVDSDPLNSTTYTASPVFGSGTQIGVGNYVIYDGTGATVTVTGLTSSIIYNFQVFEYNGTTNTINYLTSTATGNPATQTTMASPATVQATNILFPAITIGNTSATINWTSGNGGKRIVLVHSGSAVDSNPVNATTYVANAVLGSGTQIGTGNYVVYDGASNTVPVTGLSAATTYYFQVFEYNGSGLDNNFNITTAVGNPSSVLTVPNSPVANASTTVLETSFFSSWSTVSGSTGYFIDVSTDNFVSFVSGYSNKAVAATSLSVTGLAGGTNYQYRVRAGNGTGSSASSNTITTLTVPAAPIAIAATATTDQTFTAHWTASPGIVTAYFVDVASDAAFANMISGFNNKQVAGTSTSVSVLGLTAGTTYYYQVRAQNNTSTSGSSNTISQITTPPAPQNIRYSSVISTQFLLQWNATTGASSYEIDVQDSYQNFIPGYQAKSVTNIFAQVTGLLADSIYVAVVRAVNAGGASPSSDQVVIFTPDANGNGGSYLPPDIQPSTASGSNSLKAAVTSGTGYKNKITFYHRKITEKTYTQVGPHDGNSFEVQYDATNDLDAIGMEYYFKVTDGVNATDSTVNAYIYTVIPAQTIPNLGDGGGTLASYRIFSIPVVLTHNRIDEVFSAIIAQYGDQNHAKWRLLRYQDGKNVDYGKGLVTIDQGKGYWFNSIDAANSLDISGTAVLAHQGQDFSLSLEQGWTQIGNPYTFDISWGDVLLKNGNPTGVGTFKTFNPSSGTFVETDKLPAWGGGFVHSDQATSVKIPVTVKQATRVGNAAPIISGKLGEPAWFLPITLNQGMAFNDFIGVGMHPDAQLGYDRFDDFAVPRFVKYLEMNSYHPEYHTPRFSRDIVTSASHHNWEFEVESNFESEQGELNWNSQSLGDNAAQLFLYDVAAGVILDMKKINHYNFEMRGRHTFKILFAIDDKSLEGDFNVLGRPYPNPFTESITIPIITGSKGQEVRVEVYDLMGKKVREFLFGRFDSGYHEVTWDGTDEQGVRAAQGVYIYRFSCTNTATQTGRIVLK